MATVKVLPLQWYMKLEHEELIEDGYTEISPFFGRDGFYCHHQRVWFEHDGRAYTREYAAKYFKHLLNVTDDKILRESEASALETALRVTTDKSVRKVITKRLELHNCAKQLRDSERSARKYALRFTRNSV